MGKTRMKVFTSPVLVRNEYDWLVTECGLWAWRLGEFDDYIPIPKARHYDIQVSTKQWPDDSGVQVMLRTFNAGWVIKTPDTRLHTLSTVGDRYLTRWYGRRTRAFKVYFRLRYWN